MSLSNEQFEAAIVEKGLTAPRVTLDYLNSLIESVSYVKHITSTGKTFRWCIITLRNTFEAVGKPSICVSKENDNQELGEAIAYENTFETLWQLEGYVLTEKLYNESKQR